MPEIAITAGDGWVRNIISGREVSSDIPGFRMFLHAHELYPGAESYLYYDEVKTPYYYAVTYESYSVWRNSFGRNGLPLRDRDSVLVKTSLPEPIPVPVCTRCTNVCLHCLCDESVMEITSYNMQTYTIRNLEDMKWIPENTTHIRCYNMQLTAEDVTSIQAVVKTRHDHTLIFERCSFISSFELYVPTHVSFVVCVFQTGQQQTVIQATFADFSGCIFQPTDTTGLIIIRTIGSTFRFCTGHGTFVVNAMCMYRNNAMSFSLYPHSASNVGLHVPGVMQHPVEDKGRSFLVTMNNGIPVVSVHGKLFTEEQISSGDALLDNAFYAYDDKPLMQAFLSLFALMRALNEMNTVS